MIKNALLTEGETDCGVMIKNALLMEKGGGLRDDDQKCTFDGERGGPSVG